MPPTEPLAVFHLAEEGAFSEGLMQAARVPDDGRGFIVVLDDDLRNCVKAVPDLSGEVVPVVDDSLSLAIPSLI